MELGPFVSPSKHDPDVKLFLVEMQRPRRETGEARGNFPQRLPWGLGAIRKQYVLCLTHTRSSAHLACISASVL